MSEEHDKKPIEEITISIFKTSEEEYQYDIYNGSPEEAADGEPEDGGLCTTTMTNAIDMACGQAKELITINSTKNQNMENQNNELKYPRAVPSEMEFHEKAQWKVGEDIITTTVGKEKKPGAFIKLERYDDNKKPIFSCRDLDGNTLWENTSNLYELKRNLKDKEIELTEAMQKKELSHENPAQNASVPAQEKITTPETEKGSDLKAARRKKAGKSKEQQQIHTH